MSRNDAREAAGVPGGVKIYSATGHDREVYAIDTHTGQLTHRLSASSAWALRLAATGPLLSRSYGEHALNLRV